MGAGDNEWEPGSGHYPIKSPRRTRQPRSTTTSYLNHHHHEGPNEGFIIQALGFLFLFLLTI